MMMNSDPLSYAQFKSYISFDPNPTSITHSSHYFLNPKPNANPDSNKMLVETNLGEQENN